MGLATGIPTTIILALLRPELRPSHMRRLVRKVMFDHWQYGRWSSVGQAMQWIGLNSYYLAGPMLVGLDATAAIRPILNLILPVQMAVASIMTASIPALAMARYHGDPRHLRKLVWALAGGSLLLTLGYSSVLIGAGGTIIHLIYWGIFDRFVTWPLIVSLATIPVLNAMGNLLEARMRVEGQIKWVAVVKMWLAASTITLGLGICALLGLPGVFIGWATCCAVVLAGNYFMSRAFLRAISVSQLQEGLPHPLSGGKQRMLPTQEVSFSR
jgi:O-antigen/teichoic acid export membrane protein